MVYTLTALALLVAQHSKHRYDMDGVWHWMEFEGAGVRWIMRVVDMHFLWSLLTAFRRRSGFEVKSNGVGERTRMDASPRIALY